MRDGKTRRERVERQFFSLRQKRACLLAPLLFRQRSGIANRRILSARQNFAVFSHSLLRSPPVRRVKNEVVPKKKTKAALYRKRGKDLSSPLASNVALTPVLLLFFSRKRENSRPSEGTKRGFYQGQRAAFAFSQTVANASLSETASSASILRLRSMPATLRPCIRVE